ncbi:hypothetical protein [Georgenia sp. SUBG003]
MSRPPGDAKQGDGKPREDMRVVVMCILALAATAFLLYVTR